MDSWLIKIKRTQKLHWELDLDPFVWYAGKKKKKIAFGLSAETWELGECKGNGLIWFTLEISR